MTVRPDAHRGGAWPDSDQARALALAVLGRDLPPDLLDRAREHVSRQLPKGDDELYVLVVAHHLRALPRDRDWLTKHNRVRRRLARDAQHDLPERELDPVVLSADKRIASARAAWSYLRFAGLVGDAADDLVTATLEQDLAVDVRSEVA